MIRFDNVTKYYPTRYGAKYVFRNLDMVLPGDRDVGVLGMNGAGKSTLINLISGVDFPNRGQIKTDKFVSWPVGRANFQTTMTGRENVRFICRVHGIRDTRPVEEWVKEFSELGKSYELPIRGYSAGMRSKFGFASSMAFDFDVYLMDEIMAVGDVAFRRKCEEALEKKRETSQIIFVSHNVTEIEKHCDAAIVLAYGRVEFYESVTRAIARYQSL